MSASLAPSPGLTASRLIRCGFVCRERDGEKGVRAKLGFVRRAIEVNHDPINARLLRGIASDDGGGNGIFDILDRFQNAFAEVFAFVPVAKFPSFVLAGACAAGNSRTAHGTAFQVNVGFNGGVPTAVESPFSLRTPFKE